MQARPYGDQNSLWYAPIRDLAHFGPEVFRKALVDTLSAYNNDENDTELILVKDKLTAYFDAIINKYESFPRAKDCLVAAGLEEYRGEKLDMSAYEQGIYNTFLGFLGYRILRLMCRAMREVTHKGEDDEQGQQNFLREIRELSVESGSGPAPGNNTKFSPPVSELPSS